MDRIELVPRRSKLLLLMFGSIAFVVVGMFFVSSHDPFFEGDLFLRGLGVICILFFGACGVAIVRQSFDRRTRLVISDEGILDRSLKTPVISWDDIVSARIVQFKRTKFIALELVDEQERILAKPIWQRQMIKANRALGYGSFNLNFTALDMSADQALKIIARRLQDRGIGLGM